MLRLFAGLTLLLSWLAGCHAQEPCTSDPLGEGCMLRPASFFARTTPATYRPLQADFKGFMDAIDCLAAREHRACSFFIRHLFHDAASVQPATATSDPRGADATVILVDDESVVGGNNQHGEALTLRYILKKLCTEYGLSYADGLALASVQCSHNFGSDDIIDICKTDGVPLLVGKLDKTGPNIGANELPGEDMSTDAWVDFWMTKMNAFLTPDSRKLTLEEAVALMGSHNVIDLLGCAQSVDTSPTMDLTKLRRKTWDNAYYKDMMSGYVKVLPCGTDCPDNGCLPDGPGTTCTPVPPVEIGGQPGCSATPAAATCTPCTPGKCAATLEDPNDPATLCPTGLDEIQDRLRLKPGAQPVPCLPAEIEAEGVIIAPGAVPEAMLACPFGTTAFQSKAESALLEAQYYRGTTNAATPIKDLQAMPNILLQRTQWYPDPATAYPCFNVGPDVADAPQCITCPSPNPFCEGRQNGAKFWQFTTNDGFLAVSAREGLDTAPLSPGSVDCAAAGTCTTKERLGQAFQKFADDNKFWQRTYATAICKLSHIGARYAGGTPVDLTTRIPRTNNDGYKGVCNNAAQAGKDLVDLILTPPPANLSPCPANPGPLETNPWVMCDDGTACTADSCLPTGECLHSTTSATCTGCTTDAQCASRSVPPCTVSSCVLTGPLKGSCQERFINNCCRDDGDCNDLNPCTDDICGANDRCTNRFKDGCKVCTPLAASECDDNDPCTIDDCSQGLVCTNTLIPNCKTCNAATVTTDCNDNNACTDDTCVNGVCVNTFVEGCKTCNNANAAARCNDNNACTNDICTAGVCDNQIIPNCGGFRCVRNTQCDDGQACTTDTCNTATGVCSHAPVDGCKPCTDASDCNDNIICTRDVCLDTKCTNTIIANCCTSATPNFCNDNNACTADRCSPNNKCAYSVPAATVCANVTPPPKVCATAANCNDTNRCTTDACILIQGVRRCQNKRKTIGTPCGGVRKCNAVGACV